MNKIENRSAIHIRHLLVRNSISLFICPSLSNYLSHLLLLVQYFSPKSVGEVADINFSDRINRNLQLHKRHVSLSILFPPFLLIVCSFSIIHLLFTTHNISSSILHIFLQIDISQFIEFIRLTFQLLSLRMHLFIMLKDFNFLKLVLFLCSLDFHGLIIVMQIILLGIYFLIHFVTN